MIISKDKQGNWTPTAGGTGTFIGTLAAFNAIKDTLPVNTVAYITDDGNGDLQPVDAVTNGDMHPVTSNAVYDVLNSGLSPRSTGRITLVNDAGDLATSASAATEYTATDSGMVVAHIVKSDAGNTCILSVNDEPIDSFPYYSPTVYTTPGMCEITLTAFVRKGDKIKVYCDGNGDKYALSNILIQTISWYN